jgi:subtilisin family serine protease
MLHGRAAALLSAPIASLALPAALFAATPQDRELLVWLRAPPREARLARTGLPEFDALCRELGASRVAPLAPPGAPHRSPDAFHAVGLDRVVRLELPESADAAAAAARLLRTNDVELAYEPGFVTAAGDPDDPLFSSQWALQSDRLACPEAWDILNDASGVTIAVIDSGADLQHGDFKPNRWVNTDEVANNGLDDDGNGYVDDRFGYDFVNGDGNPDDDFGHGTEVSGVLGAVGNNALDIAGVCWTADVMSCKVLSSSGSGSFGDVAEAITYAVDNGALVTNMSIVASTDDPTLRAAVDYARLSDVVQVAAAGNTGDETVLYPAGYDGVLAVIATDDADQLWSSSTHGDWCDVSAPGVSVLLLKNHGGTTTLSGTSFAAPHVAGVAALVRKLNPDLDEVAVELTLKYSSEDLGAAGFDSDFAWGRLNAALALEMARSLTADATVVDDGSSVDLHLLEPADPGFLFVLLPTTQGREPGIPLSDFDAADPRVFPLNPDWLQGWVLSTPTNPIFQNFVANLDSSGTATATFRTLRRLWEGVDFDFAFVTLDPNDLAHIVHVSEPFRIRVQ